MVSAQDLSNDISQPITVIYLLANKPSHSIFQMNMQATVFEVTASFIMPQMFSTVSKWRTPLEQMDQFSFFEKNTRCQGNEIPNTLCDCRNVLHIIPSTTLEQNCVTTAGLPLFSYVYQKASHSICQKVELSFKHPKDFERTVSLKGSHFSQRQEF